MKKVKDGTMLTSVKVGDQSRSKYECLIIYSHYCDLYEIEPNKEIEKGTATEIYEECHRIYSEHEKTVS